jgi:hypothetical protein
MRKQPVTTANITGGLNVALDPVFIADTQSSNITGVRFDKGLALKDVGRKAFGTGNLTDPVLHIYSQRLHSCLDCLQIVRLK